MPIQHRRTYFPKRIPVSILFFFLCFGIYAHASHKKRLVITALEGQLQELALQKGNLVREKEELQLHIESQSDPAWVELTLMRTLGLVPEGQIKVYFER